MLRTLLQSMKARVRPHVRLFPFLLTTLTLFILPITLYHGQVITTEAHASWLPDFKEIITDALAWVPAQVAWLIFKIATLIFTMSGWFFDFALDYSTKGTTYSNILFINTAWTFIRDLINSGFIFVILSIAFKQLLSTDEVNTTSLQKRLTKIVVAALLINFSLFFTKVIIDASNVVSRGIYYRMQTVSSGNDLVTGGVKYGPAHALVEGLNLTTFLDNKQEHVNSLNKMIIYGAGAILMLISSLLFFAASFMFIIRIFMLIVLMMTSPILFATYALDNPTINKFQSQWWNELKGQSLFPVVYMLVIYIAVTYVRSDSFSLKGMSFARAFGGGQEASTSLVLLVNYIIVTALMVYALKLAKQVGEKGAGYGSKVGGFAMGKLSSTMAWTGRSTLGAAGGALAKSKFTRSMIKEGGFAGRTMGNLLVKGGEKAAQSSFDIRASKSFGFVDKQAGGMGAGKANTKTFAKDGSGLAAVGGIGTRMTAFAGDKTGALAGAARTLGRGAVIAGGGEKASEDALKKREQEIIKEITERYKDDPEAAAAMIQSTLNMGKTRFEGKAGREVRAKLAAQKKVGDAKDTLKNKETVAAASGTAEKKPEHEAALAEKKRHEDAGTAVPQNVLQNIKKFEDEAKKAEAEAKKKLAEAAALVKPEDVAGLDVKTIEVLAKSNALTVAHIKEIEKLIQEQSTFSDEEVGKLNAMAKELRKTGSNSVKTHLTNSKLKDMSPFELGFDTDVAEAATTLSTSSATAEQKAEANKQLVAAMRAIDSRELEDIDHSTLLQRDVVAHVPPAKLAAYIKRARDAGNTEIVDMAEQEALAVDAAIARETDKKKKANLTTFANALRGQGGGKKKN